MPTKQTCNHEEMNGENEAPEPVKAPKKGPKATRRGGPDKEPPKAKAMMMRRIGVKR